MARQTADPRDARHRHHVAARHRELERVRAGARDQLVAVGDADHAIELDHEVLVVDAFLLHVLAERGRDGAMQLWEIVWSDLADLVTHEREV